MRSILLSLSISIVLAGIAQAEPQDRLRTPRKQTEVQKIKPMRAPANLCAQFGTGFVRVEGSETCVKIGGSIGVGVGGSSGITMPR